MIGGKDPDLYWAIDQSKLLLPSEALKKKREKENMEI